MEECEVDYCQNSCGVEIFLQETHKKDSDLILKKKHNGSDINWYKKLNFSVQFNKMDRKLKYRYN